MEMFAQFIEPFDSAMSKKANVILARFKVNNTVHDW